MNILGLSDNYRLDLRRRRAEVLISRIMQAIDPFLDHEGNYECRRDAFEALEKLLRGEGVEIITDQIRHEIGLPPRGPDGWTLEEMHALEKARLEAMMRPPQALVLKNGG